MGPNSVVAIESGRLLGSVAIGGPKMFASEQGLTGYIGVWWVGSIGTQKKLYVVVQKIEVIFVVGTLGQNEVVARPKKVAEILSETETRVGFAKWA